MDLGETKGTIALRVPNHELARDILRRTGPMAVSSANISGQPAALTCDKAIEQLGDSVSVYLDGGPLGGSGGAPSTIVDFTQHENGQVLRRGGIGLDTLRETVPNLRDMSDEAQIPGESPSTGSGHIDDGSAPIDESSAPTDDGSAPIDAGSAPIDEGSAPTDAGSESIDEGSARTDGPTAGG
jgi:hypothetical protein